MNQALSQVVQSNGISILDRPDSLKEAMIAVGSPAADAVSFEFLLTSCPSISNVLQHTDVPQELVDSLVNAAVQSTGMSMYKVRQLLTDLFSACGSNMTWQGKFSLDSPGAKFHSQKSYQNIVIDKEEVDQMASLLSDLVKDINTEEALSVLEKMGDQGNAYANYKLGEYYYSKNPWNARTFFLKAATQGYGPAYGALADIEANKLGKFKKASDYYKHAGALSGNDGRKWMRNSDDLLSYREENIKNCKPIIALSVLGIILSILTIIMHSAFFGAIMLIASVFCFVRTVFIASKENYSSHELTFLVLCGCLIISMIVSIYAH